MDGHVQMRTEETLKKRASDATWSIIQSVRSAIMDCQDVGSTSQDVFLALGISLTFGCADTRRISLRVLLDLAFTKVSTLESCPRGVLELGQLSDPLSRRVLFFARIVICHVVGQPPKLATET
ncbi:hypothetical protein WG66_016065 [Moniliophthora roreri]|nr:hypothetical protein WG66_016065 [Moniliophthora roreri]